MLALAPVAPGEVASRKKGPARTGSIQPLPCRVLPEECTWLLFKDKNAAFLPTTELHDLLPNQGVGKNLQDQGRQALSQGFHLPRTA